MPIEAAGVPWVLLGFGPARERLPSRKNVSTKRHIARLPDALAGLKPHVKASKPAA
ncbi:hypothetical protein IVB25_33975 [Bradyrhizobium sp. 193]|nr:hypothetical protein [Bradyrhizobium sp. 193]